MQIFPFFCIREKGKFCNAASRVLCLSGKAALKQESMNVSRPQAQRPQKLWRINNQKKSPPKQG